MQTLAGGPESMGKYAAVSLIDWFKLDMEVVLVIERPVPCVDLMTYSEHPLEEHQIKVRVEPVYVPWCFEFSQFQAPITPTRKLSEQESSTSVLNGSTYLYIVIVVFEWHFPYLVW